MNAAAEAPKKRWPRAAALAVAKELCAALQPVTRRLIVAGSLRRRKPEVGDVEILYVPKFETQQFDFFSTREANLVDRLLQSLLAVGTLQKRPNVNGSFAWGDKNKLALHPSGIPVDFFSATEENWFNYLVCRTGGAENNVLIANAAIRRGWKWNPYGPGFSRGGPLAGPEQNHPVKSEREVFEFAGLPYREPWER